MGIMIGGKKMTGLMIGGKKIAGAYYGGKCVYRSGLPVGTVLWRRSTSDPATGMPQAAPIVLVNIYLGKDPALAVNGIKFHFSNVDSVDVSQDGTTGLKTNGTDTVSVPKSLIGKQIAFRVNQTNAGYFGISFTVKQVISILSFKHYTYDAVYPIITKVDAY